MRWYIYILFSFVLIIVERRPRVVEASVLRGIFHDDKTDYINSTMDVIAVNILMLVFLLFIITFFLRIPGGNFDILILHLFNSKSHDIKREKGLFTRHIMSITKKSPLKRGFFMNYLFFIFANCFFILKTLTKTNANIISKIVLPT